MNTLNSLSNKSGAKHCRLSPRYPLALAFPPEYQVNEAFIVVMNSKELS